MIAILGHIDVDPSVRDEVVATTVAFQQSTQQDEPGCLAYTISADPVHPGRVRITELWESAEALDAHFRHPNFAAAGAAMRRFERLGGSAVKYRIDAADPVRAPSGEPSTRFWSVDGDDPGVATAETPSVPDSHGAAGDGEVVTSYEDVTMFVLDDDRERRLLDTQTECTFMWTTDSGAPVGVIMNFLEHDGRFWLTCTRRRKRVAAIEARPRVALAVSSRGTDIGVSQAVTYQGTAIVHDDADVKAWFYPALAARVRPDDLAKQAAFVQHLDTPERVVIEVRPGTRIGFDSERMFQGSPAGSTRTQL